MQDFQHFSPPFYRILDTRPQLPLFCAILLQFSSFMSTLSLFCRMLRHFSGLYDPMLPLFCEMLRHFSWFYDPRSAGFCVSFQIFWPHTRYSAGFWDFYQPAPLFFRFLPHFLIFYDRDPSCYYSARFCALFKSYDHSPLLLCEMYCGSCEQFSRSYLFRRSELQLSCRI
jgi:hypothetical protein